ncbi:FAD-binding PCMH-type domain-containing protein [Salix suchowensis]|nr:FAD-binding PCMH-type domain-containing protein [Salix suchowensis]
MHSKGKQAVSSISTISSGKRRREDDVELRNYDSASTVVAGFLKGPLNSYNETGKPPAVRRRLEDATPATSMSREISANQMTRNVSTTSTAATSQAPASPRDKRPSEILSGGDPFGYLNTSASPAPAPATTRQSAFSQPSFSSWASTSATLLTNPNSPPLGGLLSTTYAGSPTSIYHDVRPQRRQPCRSRNGTGRWPVSPDAVARQFILRHPDSRFIKPLRLRSSNTSATASRVLPRTVCKYNPHRRSRGKDSLVVSRCATLVQKRRDKSTSPPYLPGMGALPPQRGRRESFLHQQDSVAQVLRGKGTVLTMHTQANFPRIAGRQWFIRSSLISSLPDDIVNETVLQFADSPVGCSEWAIILHDLSDVWASVRLRSLLPRYISGKWDWTTPAVSKPPKR